MTETVTPEVETAEAEKVVPAVEDLGEFPEMLVTKANSAVGEMTKIATRISAAGNIGQLLSEAVESSENAKVVELRTKIAKAEETLLAWKNEAQELVKPTLQVPTDEEIEALHESYKGLVLKIKSYETLFDGEVKDQHPDLSLTDYVDDIPKVRKSSGGARSGQGEGTSRPRVSSVEVSTDNGEEYSKLENAAGKSTFSAATQWIKKTYEEDYSAGDLHEAWFAQNGNVTDWQKLPEVSTFVYDVADKARLYFRVTK